MDGSDPKSLDQTYEAAWETFVSAGRIEPASGTRKRSLNVDVLDHPVIGQQRWVSLKERGLGF